MNRQEHESAICPSVAAFPEILNRNAKEPAPDHEADFGLVLVTVCFDLAAFGADAPLAFGLAAFGLRTPPSVSPPSSAASAFSRSWKDHLAR